MKKILVSVICGMTLMFAGCESNTPEVSVIGVFSVSDSKQVTFSPGNLHYTQSTNTWSFASAQWEMSGYDNLKGDDDSSNLMCMQMREGGALADEIDLFCWSSDTTYFGVSTISDHNGYSGSFVDWGTNKIGNDAPNTWRTLTYDEWDYLIHKRPNASELIGVAQVNGINGLIVLPDNFVRPSGVIFKSGFHRNFGVESFAAYKTYTAEKWSKLESAGAIFLPAAGNHFYDVYSFFRIISVLGGVNGLGCYWSATKIDSNEPGYFYLCAKSTIMHKRDSNHAISVRLVKDVK